MATNTLNEIFSSILIENLYKGSEFMQRSTDQSSFINGNVVHIPNAGAKPGTEKNRSTFPATATERDDDDLTYLVDSFTVDPIRIRNYVEFQTNYSYQQSITMNAVESLRELITDHTLNNWAGTRTLNGSGGALPGAQVFATTGADGNNLPNGTATGTRKEFTLADFRKAVQILDEQDIPKTGRVCVLPPAMYYELIKDEAIASANRFGTGEASVATGIVDRIYGVDIYHRSTVNTYSTSGTLKAVGAADATTDAYGALFYQEGTVALADGSANIYSRIDDPLHYGALISGEQLMGSSRLRGDNKGVVAIYQGA